MCEDSVAGLVWAANELPKWGMHLKGGDFIVSGTDCVPLPVNAGNSAVVSFDDFGSLQAEFVPRQVLQAPAIIPIGSGLTFDILFQCFKRPTNRSIAYSKMFTYL